MKNRRGLLNKQISKGLWVRKKLETDEEFMKSLVRKSKKLVDHMIEVLSHQELLDVVKKLVQHCVQDELEQVLCEYRSPARERNRISVEDAMQ